MAPSEDTYCVCVCFSDLTPEQQEYKEVAAKFCREEIIPKAAHYDKTGDVCIHDLMRDEKEGRRKQTNNTAHPRQSLFVTLFLTHGTVHSRQSAIPAELHYHGISAGWAQISHLIVHLMNRLTINSV